MLKLSDNDRHLRDGFIAFVSYCENKEKYSDYTVKNYLVQDKLQQS